MRLRRGAGTEVLTFAELLSEVERGAVPRGAEVMVRRNEMDVWMSLSDAARSERRLAAALHPLRFSFAALRWDVLVWTTLAVILFVVIERLFAATRPLPPMAWLFFAAQLSVVLVLHLRVGLLEWLKPRPQAVRVVARLASAGVFGIVAAIWVAASPYLRR